MTRIPTSDPSPVETRLPRIGGASWPSVAHTTIPITQKPQIIPSATIATRMMVSFNALPPQLHPCIKGKVNRIARPVMRSAAIAHSAGFGLRWSSMSHPQNKKAGIDLIVAASLPTRPKEPGGFQFQTISAAEWSKRAVAGLVG